MMPNQKSIEIPGHFFDEKRKEYPEFMKMVDLICEDNPLQNKRIKGFAASQDKDYWVFAEDLSHIVNCALIDDDIRPKEVAESYNDLCRSMLQAQIKFRKTGVYPTKDADAAREQMYDRPQEMHRYMLGLLITQMLWPNHYRLFQFFQDVLRESKPNSYLEVGAGHGMYTHSALRHFPSLEIVICDISKTSIEIAKRILSSSGHESSKVRFINADFFTASFDNKHFDFVTLGEILEHVMDPVAFMLRLKGLVLKNAVVYVSTCVNSPAVDHVYHFHSVEEIRNVFYRAGFSIEDEVILPSENLPERLWEKELITINYGARLTVKVS